MMPGPPDRSDAVVWAARTAWCLAGISLVWWASEFFPSVDTYPWLALIQVSATSFGLVLIAASWMSRDGSPPPILGWLALTASMGVFVVWCWVQLPIHPAYGTDELAFDQYAGQLVAHGHNPYAHSMAPAWGLFHVSQYVVTHSLDGSAITTLSYPSLSFLLYVPFLLLGWSTQLAQVINIAAWVVAIAMGYFLVPRTVKPLVLVLGLLTVNTSFAPGGVTDTLYLPLLIVAVYRWDRFPEWFGWRSWVAPVAMGLALSVKQTPWLVLPFLALGLYLDADPKGDGRARLRAAWTYLWRALAAFLAINLVFIAADPMAWMRGVLAPSLENLVPQGQGWSALPTVMGVGGGNLVAFTLLMAAALICALVLFVVAYPRTKAVVVLIPALVFLFAARSQPNYFVMLALPAIVAACSVRTPQIQLPAWRTALWGTIRRRVAVGGSVGLVIAALVVALAWPPPLSLRITSVYTSNSRSFSINRIGLTATNRTSQTVHPAFFVKIGGSLTAPWIVTTGPASLAPAQEARYVIQAPNALAQQSGYGGFQVVATTPSPAAMSVSAPYKPTYWRLHVYPNAVNRPVGTGAPITFVAQIVDQFDVPIDRAGVPVYFTVSGGTLRALQRAGITVNNSPGGATPIVATTNAQGTTRFTVTVARSSLTPINFQATLFDTRLRSAYAFSEVVPVVFVAGAVGP